MSDENWISHHIWNCVVNHLSESSLRHSFLPIIHEAIDQKMTKIMFESRIAKEAEQNSGTDKNIAATLECISHKITHEAETLGLPTFASLYLPLACALLGRFFSITMKQVGYIR